MHVIITVSILGMNKAWCWQSYITPSSAVLCLLTLCALFICCVFFCGVVFADIPALRCPICCVGQVILNCCMWGEQCFLARAGPISIATHLPKHNIYHQAASYSSQFLVLSGSSHLILGCVGMEEGFGRVGSFAFGPRRGEVIFFRPLRARVNFFHALCALANIFNKCHKNVVFMKKNSIWVYKVWTWGLLFCARGVYIFCMHEGWGLTPLHPHQY